MGRLEDRATKGREKAFNESSVGTQKLLKLLRALKLRKDATRKRPGRRPKNPKIGGYGSGN